jgi:imidazolonepropionase-like amidohydrolase/Tol biopolymer transport system component
MRTPTLLPFTLLFLPLATSAGAPVGHLGDHAGPEPTATPDEDAGAASAAETDGDDADAEEGEDEWDITESHGTNRSVSMTLTEGTWMSVSVHQDLLVFDLLGDIWSMPLSGGTATRITSDAAWDTQPRVSPDGTQIVYVSDRDGNEQIHLMNVDGSDDRLVTDEGEARITDPVWDPAGDWLVARRRTVDTRSIGVTELWQYHLDGGKGFAMTSLDSHPHAGEAVVTADGHYVYFSTRHSRFQYDHDPVGGLWSIARLDRRTGDIRTVATGPGSAIRPELSADETQLAFVTRDREKTLLEVMDLDTGRRRVLADWLNHDQMEGFALHGVYPDIAWLPDSSFVLWAEGKLWRLRPDGTRNEIPFEATGAWDFREVRRARIEIPDEVVAKVIRWPVSTADGRIAMSALGALWLREVDGTVRRLSEGNGYSPAWTPDGRELAWTSWSDCPDAVAATVALNDESEPCGGALHVSRLPRKTETLPITGELVNPAWDEDGQRLVVLRGRNGGGATEPGPAQWWEVVLLERQRRRPWAVTPIGTIGGGGFRAPNLRLHAERVWWSEGRATAPRAPGETVLKSMKLDGTDTRTHLVFPGAAEVVISPDFTRVAYKQGHAAHVAALPAQWSAAEVSLDALPHRTVAKEVGDWLGWEPDSRTMTWMVANVRHALDVSDLAEPEVDEEEAEDTEAGDAEVVENEGETLTLDIRMPRAQPDSGFALTHVTVLTMNGDEVLEDATIVVESDRITSVKVGGAPPAGMRVIDGTEKTVIPGLIDVHYHGHYAHGDVYPEQDWRYETQLDFGVTTVHDPSADTDDVFTMAEMVEAGLMAGPRVYSTGFVLYGALSNDGAKTPDREAAMGHVRRLQAVGAHTVKVYQQSRRDQRQWYIDACDELGMQCVAEGGGDLWMNLNMVSDGMHAIEHSLPVAPLYADVRGWMAASKGELGRGSAYTPTLLVSYGGLSGENWFFQHMSPIDDARLLRNFPRRSLDAHAWRWGMMANDGDWNHQEVARQAAKMAREDVLVTLGAHGQLQGLGAHWELWALAGPGAMTPMEAIRAATLSGATYLGLEQDLGSIEAGKLADFVVLDADPRADIHNTTEITFTVKNGAIWNDAR